MNRILFLLSASGLLLSALSHPLPARADAETCARISTFDIAPRSQDLYPAILISVDGRLPGPTQATSWRITPGKHVLKVGEAIANHEFSGVQLRERDGRQWDRYKTLEIDAKPGVTYRLAAQFHAEQRTRVRDKAYWDPVIWKESPESCH